MIGNDIVDLEQAATDSNWKRPRFLDKVFTQQEQDYIFSAEDPHQRVWLLWSMKEAAYKVQVQQFGTRFFNPKRLECKLLSIKKGLVSIGDDTYFTRSEITKDYIYTIAKQDKAQKVNTSMFKTEYPAYKTQSDTLKHNFLKAISKKEGVAFETLDIKKTAAGVPQVFSNALKLSTSFSLTHCGRFSGFAY
ncbi:4'-phosphopantetheinyl transferase superfamily protein [Lacinutrix neustonica]|uniref:4'-phosphopantetheinyl transferase superfamily protein n=1 Tax=Lacinutrix neustonica TaxID=2980107 RepID=A0A9E8MU04_9FLAO|nr:4'-phosphopantetheinyl transferase superfamily protein [Lacinutrix neustonica]WAC00939.1 4'-phosphopantetheinyl transferase superfamily protein [Lacinutrix neustonica]